MNTREMRSWMNDFEITVGKRWHIKYKFKVNDKYSGKELEVESEVITCDAEKAIGIVVEMSASKNYQVLEVIEKKITI